MPQGRPMPGELYRHFKNKYYQIVAVATHSETREPYVVYQALYGDFMTYIRPYDMFISPVDHVKYPQVSQEYRFEYVGNHNITEAQKLKESPVEVISQQSGESVQKEPELEGVNPEFLAFLDADSFSDKLKILSDMEDELDDHLINQMAASIDVIVDDGRLDDRIMELKKCIRTRAHFEVGRG